MGRDVVSACFDSRAAVLTRLCAHARCQASRLCILGDATVQEALGRMAALTDELEALSNQERQGLRESPWWAVRFAAEAVLTGQLCD